VQFEAGHAAQGPGEVAGVFHAAGAGNGQNDASGRGHGFPPMDKVRTFPAIPDQHA